MGRIPIAESRNPVVTGSYRYSRKRFGRVSEPIGVMAHSPKLMAGYGMLELAAEKLNTMPRRLMSLGEIRSAALVGCEYCLDIGSMFGRAEGVTEDQLRNLHRWRDSEHFDADERLVLELADGMTRTPVEVSDQTIATLRERFGDPAVVELVGMLALENYRARFNWAFDIGAEGFSEGAFCPAPASMTPAGETARPAGETAAA